MNLHRDWISTYTLLRREVVRILRIWSQTLVPPVITTSLYYVIFGDIVGPRIGNMQGVPYIQYIVPGLVMMAIINNAYLNVSTSVFGNKFQRNLEEMLVAPMPSYCILNGFVGGGVVRGILVGIFVIAVSLFFTNLSMYNWMVTISIAVFTSVLFALAGFVNGIFAKKFDDVAIVPMFVLTPLTYLGGVFYSVDLLPPFWQTMTLINPVFYMVNGFRYGLLGNSDVHIMYSLSIIIGTVIMLYILCLYLLNKGIGVRT